MTRPSSYIFIKRSHNIQKKIARQRRMQPSPSQTTPRNNIQKKIASYLLPHPVPVDQWLVYNIQKKIASNSGTSLATPANILSIQHSKENSKPWQTLRPRREPAAGVQHSKENSKWNSHEAGWDRHNRSHNIQKKIASMFWEGLSLGGHSLTHNIQKKIASLYLAALSPTCCLCWYNIQKKIARRGLRLRVAEWTLQRQHSKENSKL